MTINRCFENIMAMITSKLICSNLKQGKHALLNLDVPSVDRLWRTPLPPIVVCLKAESKQVVRESLQLWDKIHKNSSPSLGSSEALKSPKKIFEQFHDFEKHNGYMLSCWLI